MNLEITFFKGALIAVLLPISSVGNAATDVQGADYAIWDAVVEKILLDDVKYGGCLAYLDRGPNDLGLSCGSAVKAVTFDCLNTRGTTSKNQANQRLAAAQLALVTGNAVRLRATDAGGQPNGYCYSERIDNYNVTLENAP